MTLKDGPFKLDLQKVTLEWHVFFRMVLLETKQQATMEQLITIIEGEQREINSQNNYKTSFE